MAVTQATVAHLADSENEMVAQTRQGLPIVSAEQFSAGTVGWGEYLRISVFLFKKKKVRRK